MLKRGSQTREGYRAAGYRLVERPARGSVVLEDLDGQRELWQRRPDYAGYVVTIKGIGYEFIRTLRGGDGG